MSYYRKNKYNKDVQVEYKHCGSCKHYDLVDEDDYNQCGADGRWYPVNDSPCGSYEMADDCEHIGCFLTTCVCQHKGLPDDCNELKAMRHMRDSYLRLTETGAGIVNLYYKNAPEIVKKIEVYPEKDELLEWMYSLIKQIEKEVEEKEYDKAIGDYISLVLHTERRLKGIE